VCSVRPSQQNNQVQYTPGQHNVEEQKTVAVGRRYGGEIYLQTQGSDMVSWDPRTREYLREHLGTRWHPEKKRKPKQTHNLNRAPLALQKKSSEVCIKKQLALLFRPPRQALCIEIHWNHLGFWSYMCRFRAATSTSLRWRFFRARALFSHLIRGQYDFSPSAPLE